ncbi:MAG: prolipoprotein diacylglyceryl transferase [Chloroflexi bacterium]|nr:prolipoprotein diacylglyceryl transferase [Chloroflexota bacterium]
MITIGIDPILATIGPFSVSWHGLFIVVAIIAGVWVPVHLAIKTGLSVDRLYSMAFWIIPGGIIGTRIVHVIDYWDFYSANPAAIFTIWEGGMAIWGGILFGALTALVYARVRGFPLGPYADVAGIGAILAQAIGRIGDVINGEHISTPTSLPWGVVYTHPNSPSYGLPPTHLAVGYELLMDLAIFGLLWKLLGRTRPDGSLFLVYLSLYSIGRFFLSFLRLDSRTVFLSLNQPQWISLLVLAVAVPLLVYRVVKARQSP